MKRVEVEYIYQASTETVLEALSPERIVEYEGLYDVESVDEQPEETVVFASSEEFDVTLAFHEREDGYQYEQRGPEGPFESMETTLRVAEINDEIAEALEDEPFDPEDGEVARLILTSSFTFGSIWAFVVDRLAAGTRRDELRRLADTLATTIDPDEASTPEPPTQESG